MTTRVFGKVCEKHPELRGERMRSNRKCVACKNTLRREQEKRKYWSDPDYRVRYLENRAQLKAKWNRYAMYTANYRASKKQRTPAWANMKAIKAVYKEAARLGMTVDHYYPLNGETVSGLHVENNLRIIPQSENDSKGNKHPDEFYGEK